MKKLTLALAILLALSACATRQGSGAAYRPIIDLDQGTDPIIYQKDLTQCQAYATQVADAAESAAGAAVAGAIFGALLMAAAGGSSRNGAWVGALSGGASGAAQGERDQRTLISRCLAGRGYRVLN